MLGFIALSTPPKSLPITSTSKFHLRSLNLKPKISFIISAKNGNRNDDRIPTSETSEENGGRINGEKGKVNNGRSRLNLKWVDLLLDPDPDNLVAVGLTGLLTWASVQVLWQLFIISIAILFAALKYSLVAAVLIIILITLL